jgi:hypothetical protein
MVTTVLLWKAIAKCNEGILNLFDSGVGVNNLVFSQVPKDVVELGDGVVDHLLGC